MIKLTKENFKEVVNSDEPTVVKFHATWCGPCVALKPVYKEVAERYKGANFTTCSVGDCPEIADDNQVQSIPTILIFKSGREIGRITGMVETIMLETKIDEILS